MATRIDDALMVAATGGPIPKACRFPIFGGFRAKIAVDKLRLSYPQIFDIPSDQYLRSGE
jgi:hypothetical protein